MIENVIEGTIEAEVDASDADEGADVDIDMDVDVDDAVFTAVEIEEDREIESVFSVNLDGWPTESGLDSMDEDEEDMVVDVLRDKDGSVEEVWGFEVDIGLLKEVARADVGCTRIEFWLTRD